MRTISLVLACCVWAGAASAQDPAAEVRQAIEGQLQAAKKGDAAAYGRYFADDARWVGGDGVVYTKTQRIDRVKAQTVPSRVENVDVKVHGDTALAVFETIFDDGIRQRVARTYLKRDGRWQLALHAAVQLK
jgi:ketosteroid isomerase-like protein